MENETPQKKKRGRPRITQKQREFAKKYVELGNATEAYEHAYDAENMSRPAIHVEASRTLSKPLVHAEIERLCASAGMELSDVLTIHARNMHQSEHLPTSQRAVTDYYELMGMKKQADTARVSIAFVINRGDSQQGVEVRE